MASRIDEQRQEQMQEEMRHIKELTSELRERAHVYLAEFEKDCKAKLEQQGRLEATDMDSILSILRQHESSSEPGSNLARGKAYGAVLEGEGSPRKVQFSEACWTRTVQLLPEGDPWQLPDSVLADIEREWEAGLVIG